MNEAQKRSILEYIKLDEGVIAQDEEDLVIKSKQTKSLTTKIENAKKRIALLKEGLSVTE